MELKVTCSNEQHGKNSKDLNAKILFLGHYSNFDVTCTDLEKLAERKTYARTFFRKTFNILRAGRKSCQLLSLLFAF